MTAVIFISGILINEKYIAINFARDETRGNGLQSRVEYPCTSWDYYSSLS